MPESPGPGGPAGPAGPSGPRSPTGPGGPATFQVMRSSPWRHGERDLWSSDAEGIRKRPSLARQAVIVPPSSPRAGPAVASSVNAHTPATDATLLTVDSIGNPRGEGSNELDY